MVDMPIIVVVVNKTLIRAASVRGDALHDPIEMEWKPDLLTRAFQVIKDRYHATSIRLVLEDDLSHTFDVEIPIDVSGTSERDQVEGKLREQQPGVLTAGNWDYKLKTESASGKVMTIFVPVQEIFLQFTEAANKVGIEIEAVEPISLSTDRDPNPFLGMAKKADLIGEDREVLNIQPIFTPQQEPSQLPSPAPEVESVNPPSTKPKLGKTTLIILAVILVALLAFGVVAAVRKGSTPEPSPTPSPLATPAPSPSPTPEPVVMSDLQVNVLNGSGVPGEAGKVAKLLEELDIVEPDTGNAENYDYTTTYVSLKPNLPTSVYDSIKSVLADYTVMQGDPLEEDHDYDVVVIVGVSSKATPTPKPSATPTPTLTPSPTSSASASPSATPAN